MVSQSFEITSVGTSADIRKFDALEWGAIYSVPMKDLVSFEYNRPVRPDHWKKIAKKFNAAECDALVVNRRADGTLALIDGQHRKMAVLSLFGDEATWPCRVVRNLSFEQEAEMFCALNEQRKPVTVVERFNAALLAKDQEALAVQEIVRANGYRLSLTNNKKRQQGGTGCIAAVGALLQIHRMYTEGTLDQVLGIIREVYGTKVGPEGELMVALASFLSMYRDQYDRSRLVLVLSRLSMTQWVKEAYDFKKVMGGSPWAASRHILVKHYNHGLRNKLQNMAQVG